MVSKSTATNSSSLYMYHNLLLILFFGSTVRILCISLSLLLSTVFEPYDSAASLPPFERVPRALRGLLSWDGQHFLRIARSSRGVENESYVGEIGNIFSFESGRGGYADFEQLHAFFPLYPMLISLIAHGLAGPLRSVFIDKESVLAFSAVLINNLSTVISACLLYLLGRRVLSIDGKVDDYKERVAYTSALLFCISPCGIFFSAAYSEGLFSALSFAGMLMAEYASDDTRFAASLLKIAVASCLFMTASAVRSNGILLIGYIVYSALRISHRNSSRVYATILAAFTLILCIVVAVPYAAFQNFGYSLFCSLRSNLDHQTPSVLSSSLTSIYPQWCNNKSPFFLNQIPSLYAHVQSTYWNVGFMNYWQIKHLGMFILALPSLILSFNAVISHSFNANHLLAFARSSLLLLPNKQAKIDKELPYVIHLLFLSIFEIFFMHIQVTTRLLSSSCPQLYWHAAHAFLCASGSSWKRTALLSFFCGYSIIGTSLFSLHYNWT